MKKTETEEIREECLSELLEEHGIEATPEQIEAIARDFGHHFEMELEMASYQHVSPPSHKRHCAECDRLKDALKRSESEVEIYRNSVKKRRNASQVYIEGDSVMYVP